MPMPWELMILRIGGEPPASCPKSADTPGLGELDDVQSKLVDALPGVEFYKEPSGAEKLAEAKKRGIDFPESLQSLAFTGSGSYRGVFEGGDFTFEFSFGSDISIQFAFLDVRGRGNPLPVLHQIMQETGWAIYDMATSRLIDTEGWKGFTEWRDRCIRSIQAGVAENK